MQTTPHLSTILKRCNVEPKTGLGLERVVQFQSRLLLSVAVVSVPVVGVGLEVGSGLKSGGGGIVDVNRVAGGGFAGCIGIGAGISLELVAGIGGIVSHDFATDPTGTGKCLFGRVGNLFGIATSIGTSGVFG